MITLNYKIGHCVNIKNHIYNYICLLMVKLKLCLQNKALSWVHFPHIVFNVFDIQNVVIFVHETRLILFSADILAPIDNFHNINDQGRIRMGSGWVRTPFFADQVFYVIQF